MNTLIMDLGLRWLHILSAVTLAGGVFFWRWALLGSLEALPEANRQEFAAAIRPKWARLVMASSGLLLLSGLVNFMFVVQRYDLDKTAFPGSKYHMLFGIKFLVALSVFLLSALLAGRTSTAEKLRNNARFWLNVNLVLVIVVVCLGGLLKAAPRQAKSLQSLQREPETERPAGDGLASLNAPPKTE